MAKQPLSALQRNLIRLRQAANYSQKGLAAEAGLQENAVKDIESGKSKSPRGNTLKAIADALEVSVDHLQGSGGSMGVEPAGLVWVNELDVRAAAGQGGSMVDITADNEEGFVVGRYAFPERAFEETFGVGSDSVKICSIVGNSMAPDLMPGQRVMVDLADRVPSPPGIFYVFDGLGIVCKLVEYIPHSNPARVRISSKNEAFLPYERDLEEAYICGRVVGFWQRT